MKAFTPSDFRTIGRVGRMPVHVCVGGGNININININMRMRIHIHIRNRGEEILE